jgi:hypothetical protein
MAAWTEWYYKHSPRLYYDVGSPHAYAVIAIKRELRYLGYGAIGFDTEKPVLASRPTC